MKPASSAGPAAPATIEDLAARTRALLAEEAAIRSGGGAAGVERQRRLGRLTARERLERLLDRGTPFLELGLWCGWRLYPEWGDTPAAGVVAGIGRVSGRRVMVVANDATVKAGAMFPQSIKKTLRAQKIALENGLPLVYLVDSAGVFLPLQDEVFPDEDDFGRIFRNNSVLSAAGIPQIAAILGNCVGGGAYLPVLCDKIVMTDGSGLYLAGPPLVKAAIGQEVSSEDLGGAAMHAQVSGTVDFREPNDERALERVRQLVAMLPADAPSAEEAAFGATEVPIERIHQIVSVDGRKEFDVRQVIGALVDRGSVSESKAEYGRSIVTAYATLAGRTIGIVANQRMRTTSKRNGLQVGGVIYSDGADKAARFILDCNQIRAPLLFLQDVSGFMVGRDSEHNGIIRSGAKLVSAVSNSTAPKVTLILGGSFGAGHYAMCGRAYDPRFIFAWPCARYGVMGADQAADTLLQIQQRGRSPSASAEELAAIRDRIRARYNEQLDVRYGAARGWVDAILAPEHTRAFLIEAFDVAARRPGSKPFPTGVMQT